MNKKERYEKVLAYFKKNNPYPETELKYKSPYELLVAVILSAQCTDKRVNIITPSFFKMYPTVIHLASAGHDEVFSLVKSCSYPNNKTKHLIDAARTIVSLYNGDIPSDIKSLTQIPGIGRKSANVIAAVIFNQPVIAVDTHVFRVSERIGLTTNAKNPLETEKELTHNIQKDLLNKAHHWLILHGRYICVARKPKCYSCGISMLCRYFNLHYSCVKFSADARRRKPRT